MSVADEQFKQKSGIIRLIWILCLAMLSSATLCHAERLYVSGGYREIMLRSGPSVEHRILGTLKTGDRMEATSKEGAFSLVMLPDGRQGYVLTSFLTPEAPPQRQIEELAARVREQSVELEQLRRENAKLITEHEKLSKGNSSNKRQLHRLQQESSDLRRDMRLRWFGAGAGVLLTGWLMGWTRVRLRRRAHNRSFT